MSWSIEAAIAFLLATAQGLVKLAQEIQKHLNSDLEDLRVQLKKNHQLTDTEVEKALELIKKGPHA